MRNSEKCVAPGCKENVRCRGLCEKHYSQAYYEVEVKQTTTWAKLEKKRPPLARPKLTAKNSGNKFRQAISEIK